VHAAEYPGAALGRIARRLRVGMTSINDVLVCSMNPAVPFGGRFKLVVIDVLMYQQALLKPAFDLGARMRERGIDIPAVCGGGRARGLGAKPDAQPIRSRLGAESLAQHGSW
jgi:hypothetical protein